MQNQEIIYDIAIIGAGAAGQMGVLRSVLNNKNTIAFTGDAQTKRKSRATWVHKVVNMPMAADLNRPISSATKDTFEWIKAESGFADKFTDMQETVISLEKDKVTGHFNLKTNLDKEFKAKYVLLATGIMDIQPEIDGSIKPVLPYANQGHVDYCVRCDGHKSKQKITATIGHTAAAAWVAIMLYERYQPPAMKIFTNGQTPEFPPETLPLLEAYKIKVVREPIIGIKGDPKEKMEAFILKDCDNLAEDCNKTKEEPVELAFAMLGQIAYNDLAKQVRADINSRGNIICNPKGESSVTGLYVAGDLRDTGKYQIYTAWDQAVDSVDDMDAKLRLEYREEFLKKSKLVKDEIQEEVNVGNESELELDKKTGEFDPHCNEQSDVAIHS
jgi:thioredoxin reductase (NADPH)